MKSPLEGEIKALKFTPFQPPRGGDGAGTVVSFNWRGEESPIAKSDCLVRSKNALERVPIGTMVTSYSLTNGGGFEFDLGKIWSNYVQLDAAFRLKEVKSIKVSLYEPFTEKIFLEPTKALIKSMTNSDSCFAHVDKKALILHTVLGAKGVSYEFIGEGGQNLKLNATIMKQIGLKPNLQSDYQGKASLNIKQEMLLGYRAWRVKTVRGVITPDTELEELMPKEVETLREAARKNR